MSWSDADELVRAYANGLLARGVSKGDAFGILAQNSLDWALIDFALAQIGAVGIPIYANNSARDVGYLLAHSEAVGIVCEDAAQLAKVETMSDELPRARARPHLPRPRRTGRARRRLRAHPSRCSRRRVVRHRRGRPLHDHLHVGDDRPPEGLHAQPSQLLRDDERRRLDAGPLPRGRRHAPVPAARAQLRAADAPHGCLRRVSDRVPPRPAAGRGGDARGAAERAAERAARLREGVRRGAVPLRRGDGREAAAHRLGATDRA